MNPQHELGKTYLLLILVSGVHNINPVHIMFTCSFCGNKIGEHEWRIERYRHVFCDNHCMMSFASKLEPKSFGALITRLIPRPQPLTVRLGQERR